MSFERGSPIPNGNKDSWSCMTRRMPIPHENGIGHSQDSWTTISSGIEIVGDGDPTMGPRRPMLMDNGIVHNTDSWNTTTERTSLQRNGVDQSGNSWIPPSSDKHINEKQENQLETEKWQELIGMYTDLLQEKTLDTNGILEEINPTPTSMAHSNGNQNWVSSITKKNLSPTLSPNPYQNQTSNQASFNTSLTSMLGSHQTQMFTSSNLISNGHSPKDGFPVTYGPHYSPSSPPKLKPDESASSIIDSFPFAPITPDNQRKHMGSQRVPEKVNFLVEETLTLAKNRDENQTVSIKDAENLYNELLQTIGDSPTSAISTTQKEHIVSEDKDEQAIDLNKTPTQKTPTRRKKHRPKVIREGKPKRTPKPKDLRNGSSNEIRVKRKYVRRKDVNNSNEKTPVENIQKRKYVRKIHEKTPVESIQKRKYVRKKGVDHLKSQHQSREDDTPPKSCKKQLNFDLENVAQDENHEIKNSQQEINVNVNSQDIEQVRRMFQQPMQGLNVPNGLNVHARNMTTIPKEDRWENSYNYKVNEPVHEKEIKNTVFQADRPTNQQGTPQSFTSEGMVSLDEKRGIKRQSSEQMGHNVNAMNSLLLYQKLLLGVANRAYEHNNLNSNLLENHKKMKMQSEFQDNSRQMKGIYGNGPAMELLNSCTGRIDLSCNKMNVGRNGGNRQFLPPMAGAYYLQEQQVLSGMQQHAMRLIPERSPKYTQGAIVSWNPPPPTPPKGVFSNAITTYPKLEKNQIANSNSYNQRLNGLNEMLQQHRDNSLKSYQQSSTAARGRPRKQKAEVSVDDITYKLENLHIYDGNKKQQNELVLYRESDAIIPFEPIKKRVPRPKVDLDPETERLWNLLMGPEGSEGAEKLDKDKEKWWENERRVFRGRADSFIARMHLVQGDRRFSRWKGSVVDSVIGVFLTQNVSDHLSSSAFMSLAAKFPLKSITTNCQQPPSQEPNDITKCHEKITTSTEEEVILSQNSFDSSTIQMVDEFRSSSGSNSEAEDVITGFETSQQSGPPQKEKSTIIKDSSCHDNQTTSLDDLATNMQIPRMNEINLSSSSSNLTYSQNEKLSSYPSQLLKTNQQVTEFFKETTGHDETVSKGKNGSPQQDSTMFGGTTMINVEDRVSVADKQICFEDTVTEANSKQQRASHEPASGPGPNMPKTKRETNEDERRRAFDWDSLRKQALSNGEKKERSKDAMDTIDYEALRQAQVNEISDAIRERGMNNLLADRIKDFLNRLVKDHGSIDLEWLRDAPPDKAKDYLLSFRGLGLKSVECVRLLTLHHLAFPVDTNVGRIAVRLGWVPLQPLPESLQLHLLEMYPVLESIQKYLWPRLCKLDQLTLYELHYQMITFGKVFCTKSKPNCNACPMRAECRHFASAFASARLSLPGPAEKRIVTSNATVTTDPIPPVIIRPMPLPPAENDLNKRAEVSRRNCEPIIEEPTTPEPEANELSISDIEDQYYEDSDEIPSIKLNMEEFTTNLQNIIQDNNDMSKALVALNPKAASIPTPKLKDVSRLRTEHQVYELPDSHQLLEGLDKREPDDPSPYLLAIWTPGETANSVQPPETGCLAQRSGQLCDRTTCFSCNSVKEANSQVVRGTILIPCRTAMRGSFPLNGTYFQVNEMFADHASSLNPIDVPRAWIWNLPRRTVYFGTSVSTIFKGLTTEGIQYCFWKGFVCVRGFDQINRAPRPLMARLHFPASKLITQKTKANK